MSGAEARLLAHRLLAASAEDEWLADHAKGEQVETATRELCTFHDDALHDQAIALERRIGNLLLFPGVSCGE